MFGDPKREVDSYVLQAAKKELIRNNWYFEDLVPIPSTGIRTPCLPIQTIVVLGSPCVIYVPRLESGLDFRVIQIRQCFYYLTQGNYLINDGRDLEKLIKI